MVSLDISSVTIIILIVIVIMLILQNNKTRNSRYDKDLIKTINRNSQDADKNSNQDLYRWKTQPPQRPPSGAGRVESVQALSKKPKDNIVKHDENKYSFRRETDAQNKKSSKSNEIDWANESPLSILGYRVGKTKGLPPDERHDILKSAVEDHLPTSIPREYLEKWGTPGTQKRLQRIVDHLKFQIEIRAGRGNYLSAIDDWSSDLEWLRQTYRSRFPKVRW